MSIKATPQKAPYPAPEFLQHTEPSTEGLLNRPNMPASRRYKHTEPSTEGLLNLCGNDTENQMEYLQ